MPELKGRVAIVTGGSRGIGRAIAEALVDSGVRVAIGARKQADLDEAARELNAKRPGEQVALGVRCDVRSYDDCKNLVDQTVAAFGRLDILVNNAGIGNYAYVADMQPEQWRAVIETNLNSLFYCSHLAIPHLRNAGGDAWIINIGSLAGKNAFPGGAAYNASKFGLIGFSEALMQEVRNDGIRVSYIMPGSVASEFVGWKQSTPGDWKIQPEDIAQIITDLLRMPARALPSRIEVRPTRPPNP